MKPHLFKTKYLLILSAVILTALSVIGVLATRYKEGQQPQDKRVTKLPLIISRVRNLEGVSAKIEREGEPTAMVAVEIRNNSDKPIIAIALESGNEKDSSGVNHNGFNEGQEPPSVILNPHNTIILRMPLSNLNLGEPIRIGGVMYADGTEDGDEKTLRTMREQKEHYKAKAQGGH